MSEKVSKAARKMAREVEDQREEILTAFVSKYGFQPDECQQLFSRNSWRVVRIPPEDMKRVQRELILARLSQKQFTLWQRVCLAMAGL